MPPGWFTSRRVGTLSGHVLALHWSPADNPFQLICSAYSLPASPTLPFLAAE